MPLWQLQVVPHSALLHVAGSGGARLSLGQAELRGSVAVPAATPWGGGAQEAGSTPRSWVPRAQCGAVSTAPPCFGECGNPWVWNWALAVVLFPH